MSLESPDRRHCTTTSRYGKVDAMTTPAIDIQNVTKRFGQLTAVDQLSLRVHPGEILALLGPNGAGKTTLLDMILGYTTPQSGSVKVLAGPPTEASGRIGAVLQTKGLLEDLTVEETLRMIAGLHRHSLPIPEVMEKAGVTAFKKTKVGKCSGGQVQRLRFALAILPDPEILLLDEPTSGMDITSRRGFWDSMTSWARGGGTIIFATHYLQEAEEFADRIVVMKSGSITADAPADQLGGTSTITGTWRHSQEPFEVLPEKTALDWDPAKRRISIRTDRSDQLANELLNHGWISNVQITQHGLENLLEGDPS